MERIIDTKIINIEIKSISNSDNQSFAPIDKVNIIISDNGKEVINATISSRIYYKIPNPVRELEKYLLGIDQSNNEIIKKRDIALCKKYTELTIDKGISIDEALKLITEDIFFISKDQAIGIINNHEKLEE